MLVEVFMGKPTLREPLICSRWQYHSLDALPADLFVSSAVLLSQFP